MAWRSGHGRLCRGKRSQRLDSGATETEMQRAVLGLLLVERTEPLTFLDVYEPLLGNSSGLAEQIAVMSAVRDLAFAGLLHSEGPYLRPTEAALRFHALAVSE